MSTYAVNIYGDTFTTSTSTTTAAAWLAWNTGATFTDDVWRAWATEQTATSTITTTFATADDVWRTTSRAWIQWVTYDDDVAEADIARRVYEQQRMRSSIAERNAAASELRKKLTAEREAADALAEALLLDNVTTAQREQFKQTRCIVVRGGRTGLRYRLRLGRTGNIDAIDKQGRISHRLCAHPRDDMPDADCVLTQKLMIELAEDEFLRIANRHPAPVGRAPVLEADTQ